MRVLASLFFSVLAVSIMGVFAFLVTREALLVWGVSVIRQSMVTMRQLAVNSGPYGVECRKKGISDEENAISAIQLRFLSDTEYVVEIVCGQFKLEPIIVETKQLPMMVSKTPGSAGLIFGSQRSGFRLQVWGRSRAIIMEEHQLSFTSNARESLGVGPLSSCSGYGYECCAEETSKGVGEAFSEATDCPRSCFPSCQRRPVVLSLSTDPYFDPELRQLEVGRNLPVEFVYVVDSPTPTGSAASASPAPLGPVVTIVYGDGSQETASTLTGRFSHVYSCSQAACTYQAVLKVVDAAGVESALTPISKVQVVVR